MTHDLFGKLKYKREHECWIATAPLARFAALGTRTESPPTEEEAGQMVAEMNQALDSMRGQMREKFGPAAEASFAALDAEIERSYAEDEPASDPRETERNKKHEKRAKNKAARLARGEFAIRILDPDETGPTPPQEAAFRHLVENETPVRAAVLEQVWESFQSYYGQEHWRQMAGIKPATSLAALTGRFAVPRVGIIRPYRGGFAHLLFEVEADWQDEHGLVVVYSPDTREAAWTTFDGLDDLTPSDDPGDGDLASTPHDQLVEAVLNGDEARANDLLTAGADINALAPDEYPPLCMAVDQVEADEVRRLLKFGADPNLADPVEKKTPLKMAKRLYKEMGFTGGKKQDPILDAMMALARETAGKQLDEMKAQLDEIVRLLEEAGGK